MTKITLTGEMPDPEKLAEAIKKGMAGVKLTEFHGVPVVGLGNVPPNEVVMVPSDYGKAVTATWKGEKTMKLPIKTVDPNAGADQLTPEQEAILKKLDAHEFDPDDWGTITIPENYTAVAAVFELCLILCQPVADPKAVAYKTIQAHEELEECSVEDVIQWAGSIQCLAWMKHQAEEAGLPEPLVSAYEDMIEAWENKEPTDWAAVEGWSNGGSDGTDTEDDEDWLAKPGTVKAAKETTYSTLPKKVVQSKPVDSLSMEDIQSMMEENPQMGALQKKILQVAQKKLQGQTVKAGADPTKINQPDWDKLF